MIAQVDARALCRAFVGTEFEAVTVGPTGFLNWNVVEHVHEGNAVTAARLGTFLRSKGFELVSTCIASDCISGTVDRYDTRGF